MQKSYDVVLLGAGNVGYHLANRLKDAGHTILQVYSRSLKSAETLAAQVTAEPIHELAQISKNASVYIIALRDDIIAGVALQLELDGKLVLHTSASIPMEVLISASEKFGVLYPLQTLTKGIDIDFRHVPLCIEASDENVNKQLHSFANSLSDRVFYLDSGKRKALHVSAVIVNNFSNHLFHVAEEILHKENLDFDLLKPLIKETVRKLDSFSPHEIQTGPAKRNDLRTIDEHLHYLDEYPDVKEIYLVMTESILQCFKEKIIS